MIPLSPGFPLALNAGFVHGGDICRPLTLLLFCPNIEDRSMGQFAIGVAQGHLEEDRFNPSILI